MRTFPRLHSKPLRSHGPARRFVTAILGCWVWAALPAFALTITNVTVVNVTPHSFDVLWRADASTPSIAVYADAAGLTNLAGQLGIEAFPLHTGNPALTNAYLRRQAASVTRQKTRNAGLNLMRVTGCQPATTYFFRLTSTPDSGSPAVYPGTGSLPGVTTESENTFVLNAQQLVMDVVGADTEGFVVLFSPTNAAHPLAAVVGDGVNTNQVFFNVSDLFALGGGGNYAIPGPQQFYADVLGPAVTDQQQQFSLTFTTQFTVAQTTQIGVTNEYVTLALGSTVLLTGQTGDVPVNFNSTAGIGVLDFLVDIPPERLTNLTLQALAPQIDGSSVSITSQGGSTLLVHLVTLPGQSLLGGQQIAQLAFRAVSNQSSAFVPMRFVGATAAKPAGSPVNVPSTQSGRAVVIGNQSLLENSLGAGGTRQVALYGRPGTGYQLLYTTNLDSGNWFPAAHFPLTNFVATLSNPGPPANAIFFRAAEFAPDPPVLDVGLAANGSRTLVAYGLTGHQYTLQYATNLADPISWLPLSTITLTNPFQFVTAPAGGNLVFYRLVSTTNVVASGTLALGLGNTVVLAGQAGQVPLTFTSTVQVASIAFTFSVPLGYLTNFSLLAVAPEVDPASLVVTSLGGGASRLQLAARVGQSMNGAQTLAQLNFVASPTAASAFVPMQLASLAATKVDTGPVASLSGRAGRVVVVGPQPLLEPDLATGSSRTATLYSQPWMSYSLQVSSNLLSWREVNHFPETNLVSSLPLPGTGNQFYRVETFTPDPPVLEALLTGGAARQLLFYGRPGSNYTVFSATNLSGLPSWLPFASYPLTNSFRYVPLPNTNGIIFHRLRRN